MSAQPLRRVLEATGYLNEGEPAPGVRLGRDARRIRGGSRFEPDASWRGTTATTIYFKYADDQPNDAIVSRWHREVWNEGFAPLLWVISPRRIDLYNGFGRPEAVDDAEQHRLRTFRAIEQELVKLDQIAGRLAMETGQFWLLFDKINRKTSVDEQLLSDLAALERDLVLNGLERGAAQGLIGRSIFTQYLIDREIVGAARLEKECSASRLPAALRDPKAAERLFAWLAETFNGDMFPPTAADGSMAATHYGRVADFLEAVDPKTGQRTFFPYQFDIIPVELISSIYEQFAHSKIGASADDEEASSATGTPGQVKRHGVHYTRLPVVSLILDEVMSSATGHETVLDLTCGSGVFLVEALRRLVARKGGECPPRELIRSTLYEQIYGVDITDAAVRVAAFSLYLAALELDPDPRPPEALTFQRLIGRNLLIGDARDIEAKPEGANLLAADGRPRVFDVIVGNPPWTFRGKAGTHERRSRQLPGRPRQPRGEGLDFVLRATEFNDAKTRFGIVLSAMPFFAGSRTGAAAARYVIEQLSPATLVNLAPLTKWLFPTAKMPAVVLLARCRPLQSSNQLTVVNVPWSPSAEKSYTFEIAPSDIAVLPLADWAANPDRLKTAVFGRGRDILLLENLRARFKPLQSWLAASGSEWRDGLILGKPQERTRDAQYLRGLEVLGTRDLNAFRVPATLPRFAEPRAQWPRSRGTYQAPILLIKEFLKGGPRPVTAVAERDLVYTDAYFGAALKLEQLQSARLISALLGSALASWFFLLTASEFGIWKRRLLTGDVGLIPLPDPYEALRSDAGEQILKLEMSFRGEGTTERTLQALDAATFELYGLDKADQVVVQDGLTRAG